MGLTNRRGPHSRIYHQVVKSSFLKKILKKRLPGKKIAQAFKIPLGITSRPGVMPIPRENKQSIFNVTTIEESEKNKTASKRSEQTYA